MYLMDDTQTCCGCELCPVSGSCKPFQVFSTKSYKIFDINVTFHNCSSQTLKYIPLFLQLSYLRNWSLVVPVCMKELAITVAV